MGSSKTKEGASALVVMAKEPVKSRVKTRLEGALDADLVLKLYTAFLKDVLAAAKKVRCSGRFIYYTETRSPRFLAGFAKDFVLVRQSGRNLGERMWRAAKRCAKGGFTRTVFIGSDLPYLRPREIETAFRNLKNADIVLGPCTDGGYYLLALKEPGPGLFHDIHWGSNRVLDQTLKRVKQMKKRAVLLKTLRDIDTLDDLAQLIRSRKTARQALFTNRLLRQVRGRLIGCL